MCHPTHLTRHGTVETGRRAKPLAAALFLATLFSFSGCTTMKLTPYQPESAKSLSLRCEESGVTVGIDPITDGRLCRQHFGKNLLADKIIPVYVVVDNRSTKSFIVSKDNFQMGLRREDTMAGATRDELQSSNAGEAVAIAGAVAGSPVLLVIGAKLLSDSTVIHRNYKMQELQRSTVSPGRTAQGFVYFELPTGSVPPERWFIQAQFADPRKTELLSFDFELTNPQSQNH